MPVDIPFLASIEIVKAVCILDLFICDIKGSFNFSICFFVKARQINPPVLCHKIDNF